ncbi:TonB-dependent receptor [Nemorincola caseinilytica]|uniref:TonB-dependent receptor n=1 Tax=Nemorincola caseinilytica TaxID=2054315 RepID=A0ABP8N5U2_9BACT
MFTFPIYCHAQDTVKHLNAVEVRDRNSSDFRSMNQVEGMKLTAGKKTELINVEQLTVNKSTNNARQVYAKVAGLNIFENDGSGLQLSIGGRGLDPNRTSNFNVRQNGYDISADALGYPESYYTPPTEALKKIEVIKGASGLQYGTQFGGLLNFEMKQPDDLKKPLEIESRQTAGSWGYFGSYNSIGGTSDKLSYFGYLQYKRGDGWRPNSGFEAINAYADLHYHISNKHMLGLELTHLNYLSQQPGGLTDAMFAKDPRQSNRSRNWFAVNWNLADLEWDFHITERTRWQTRASGLYATRNALGYRPNRPSQPDNGTAPRDLLKGVFRNGTLESRIIHRYKAGKQENNLLAGIRAYYGRSKEAQGYVQNGSGPQFSFADETSTDMMSDYEFPNMNYAAFVEHIFRLGPRLNITPGLRAEHIRTRAQGYYRYRETDLANNPIIDTLIQENRSLPRTFVIAGVGAGYKLNTDAEFYGNLSQNYRSVTFSDIRTMNPSFQIDPNIQDEKGWSGDLGIRGSVGKVLRYDANVFFLHYGNRIGEYLYKTPNYTVIRRRSNIGQADIYGLESFLELNALQLAGYTGSDWKLNLFTNLALTQAGYTKSMIPDIQGKRVEYVPLMNLRTGVQGAWKSLKMSVQLSALSEQYADATNATDGLYSAVNGLIPAYRVADISAGYTWRRYTVEGTVNNVLNAAYFTRRATGYPGPGIIPGDGRGFFITLGVKI